MAFEDIKDILDGDDKQSAEKSELEHRHVGGGEPMESNTEKIKEIAHAMAENEEELQTARQEGDILRVRELNETRDELIAKRTDILKSTAQDRLSRFAEQ